MDSNYIFMANKGFHMYGYSPSLKSFYIMLLITKVIRFCTQNITCKLNNQLINQQSTTLIFLCMLRICFSNQNPGSSELINTHSSYFTNTACFLNILAMFLPTHSTDQICKCMTLGSNTDQLELNDGSDTIRHS